MDSLNVMIVDDAPLMVAWLTMVMEELGHKVVGTASNGREAIDVYKACRPDLVTMDIRMPVMDGIEATKAIMSAYPDAKIIMTTADGQDVMILNALKAGAKGYLLKSSEQMNVAEVIQKACKRKP